MTSKNCMSTPQDNAVSKQNKGHLGSRYIYISSYKKRVQRHHLVSPVPGMHQFDPAFARPLSHHYANRCVESDDSKLPPAFFFVFFSARPRVDGNWSKGV